MAIQYPIASFTETVISAATPSNLQQIVAYVSFGDTTLSTGTRQIVRQLSDISSSLTADSWLTSALTTLFAQGTTAVYVLELGQSGGGELPVATATIADGKITAADITSGGQYLTAAPVITISGDGTGAAATATVENGVLTGITITEGGSDYTEATFSFSNTTFNQAGLIASWISSHPLQNYLYVLSDAVMALLATQIMLGNYDSSASYTYFLGELSVAQVALVGDHKSYIPFSPSANAASTEFGASAIAYMFSSLTPSAVSKIRPFNLRFVDGVTEYADISSTTFNGVIGSNTNVVIPATAGGLTENMLLGGQCSDGNAINIWYGADYASLSVTRALTAAIINGSNNSENPLDFDQSGINLLYATTVQTLNSAIGAGAIIGPVTVTYTDFATYAAANPSDYQKGIYRGISFTVVPARGFDAITYGMVVDLTAATVAVTSV